MSTFQCQPPLSQKKSAVISGIALTTYCPRFQGHWERRFVTALDTLLIAPRELTFEHPRSRWTCPCHRKTWTDGQPDSVLLSEPVSVCGPGHPRSSKAKLEKDTWVVHYVRETNTCQQTPRIRTLSFVNKL